MDLEVFKTGLMVINMVGTFAIGIWLYLEKRSDKTNARIDATNTAIKNLEGEVDGRLDRHGQQLAHLEAKAEGAITHEDLSDLHEKINKVRDDVAGLGGQFRGVEHLLNTIHHHLLGKT